MRGGAVDISEKNTSMTTEAASLRAVYGPNAAKKIARLDTAARSQVLSRLQSGPGDSHPD